MVHGLMYGIGKRPWCCIERQWSMVSWFEEAIDHGVVYIQIEWSHVWTWCEEDHVVLQTDRMNHCLKKRIEFVKKRDIMVSVHYLMSYFNWIWNNNYFYEVTTGYAGISASGRLTHASYNKWKMSANLLIGCCWTYGANRIIKYQSITPRKNI